MRFYLDEDISHQVASIARAGGLDVISSHECGRNGLPDEQQLRLAAAEGRCFVTRNRNDFELLTVRFFEAGWPHAGVLIVQASWPGHRFAALAEALARYAQAHPDGVPSYGIDFLRR
ncbi:MAG: DUF5615 family PIN-like protein [Chloroflexi bacterium]|nr:DUF5615 family PIN-like protein [Chloroflexota bacterium]